MGKRRGVIWKVIEIIQVGGGKYDGGLDQKNSNGRGESVQIFDIQYIEGEVIGFINVECQRKLGNKFFVWVVINIEYFLRCGRLYKEGIVSGGMEDVGGELRV